MMDHLPPSLDDGERETLLAFLDYLRECVVAKLEGISEADALKTRSASGTSILWLAQHLVAVEINLFQRILEGRSESALSPPRSEVAETLGSARLRYATACAESRTIAAAFPDLGALGIGFDRRAGRSRTVRWVLVHAIEETARHAGHLDILREAVDGKIGR
jgi:Protein of unknown function (DUF664)